MTDGAMPDGLLNLGAGAIGMLMPMHLCISPTGHIRSVGPTLVRVCDKDRLLGRRFLEVFELRRPRSVRNVTDLIQYSGAQLVLCLRDMPTTQFKGIAVSLEPGQGLLLNLSFGISVAAAVRDFNLSIGDFAPTDLTVEMLYLSEAQTAVLGELRRLNQRLQGAKLVAEELAMTDAVTGLRNRRAMDRVLSRVVLSGMPFSLMNLDLDFFKQVNDTFGHAAGDHVLDQVAQILCAETRGNDTVARVGGDEFVLVFPGLIDPAKLATLAERILVRLEVPIPFGGNQCRISASMGTTLSTDYPLPDPARMLSDADKALYHSKRTGRRRVTAFSEALAQQN